MEKQTLDNSIELLNEIYKNLRMGIQSIDVLLSSIKSNEIIEELSEESSRYSLYEKETIMIANSKDYNLKDNSIIQKTQVWLSVKINLLASATTQHIAEMMLIGTMMGVIDLVKATTNYPDADNEIMDLAYKLIEEERNNIDNLFEYLKVKNDCDDENIKNNIK